MGASEEHRKANHHTKTLCINEFANSALFSRMFSDGMKLVEDTTHWLEGPGRGISTSLSRDQALIYASQCLNMTTRLMQVAAWLVVHRAVRDGETSPGEAQNPKFRIPPPCQSQNQHPPAISSAFADLDARTRQFYERIYRLDFSMHGDNAEASSALHPLDALQMAHRDGALQLSPA